MGTHELDIEIAPDGTVHMRVRGTKGSACDKYAEWLIHLMGGESAIEHTAEYYEQPIGIDITLDVHG